MNKREIIDSLKNLGLQEGDIVLLHSSFLSIGPVEGGPETLVNAFLDLLGPSGTLLVPVFGALGIVTEVVRNHPQAVISSAPVGTLAGIGAKAREICADHWQAETAHGENTPFLKMAEAGGYICLLGVDQDRNTTLHSVEALLRLPYLGTATRTFVTPDGESLTKTWNYYPGPHRDFIGLDRHFRDFGILTEGCLGQARIRLIRAQSMLEVAAELGGQNPAFALCDNPNCPDCVRQRAALFSARIATHERFQLAASSRLAGRYLPEIIENLQRTGLKAVELDFLQGRPAASLDAQALTETARQLNEAGLAISALRLQVVPADLDRLLKAASQAAITRLVLPLSTAAQDVLQAQTAGFTIALANNVQTAETARQQLAALPRCGFAFNPAAFVGANEHPFGHAWRVGRFIRTIAQLDVIDATWTGEYTALARGHGEIKELVSILRCQNFAGWLVLGGGGIYPGTLTQAVNHFQHLLDTM